jgi:hypothetical protein
MNKNVIAVFAAACGLSMASCDTPKDLRPEDKVSVDLVEPGTRNTHNVGGVNEVHPNTKEEHQEVMPNHDSGDNEMLQPGDSIREAGETNTKAGATKNQ